MDISRLHCNEDTTTSMYLSFDAESTMPTACYKTLEAISDTSSTDIHNSQNLDKTKGNTQNSTLEPLSDSRNISPEKTVKKIDFQDAKLNTSLRVLPKNILKEYKDWCSTPAKDQLLKTVEVTRGSDATRCADLGLAFLGVDDEKPASFPVPSEENKENALPDIEEVSTLSTCSSEIAAPVIEKKMICSMPTMGSITKEEKTVEDVNVIKTVEDDKSASDMLSAASEINNVFQHDVKAAKILKFSKNLKHKCGDEKSFDVNTDSLEIKEQKISSIKSLEIEKDHNKMKLPDTRKSFLKENIQRSVCESNMQKYNPSKIFNADNKRRSFLPTCKKQSLNIDAEKEIPLLMSKMLKITSTPMEAKESNERKEIVKNTTTDINGTIKSRKSVAPSFSANKRTFTFKQPTSVVVKTTLNSPARKIVRKSLISSVTSFQTSTIPRKINTVENLKYKKTDNLARKSMYPNIANNNIYTQSGTKSLDSLDGVFPKKCMANTDTKLSRKNPIISYTCNVCKENFCVKSLLDAHKRSHESDSNPPSFVKKPSTQHMSGSLLGISNQCKYCDKKFALLKALHIHLLQNCTKIPPSEKRKLLYTDLNHVEKAQLPKLTPHSSLHKSASSLVSSVSGTSRHVLQQNIPRLSLEYLNENKDMQTAASNITATPNANNVTSTQTSNQKAKKITAHAGVYRTPSKTIPCHLCKLTFKSILAYTNHNLANHGVKKKFNSPKYF